MTTDKEKMKAAMEAAAMRRRAEDVEELGDAILEALERLEELKQEREKAEREGAEDE